MLWLWHAYCGKRVSLAEGPSRKLRYYYAWFRGFALAARAVRQSLVRAEQPPRLSGRGENVSGSPVSCGKVISASPRHDSNGIAMPRGQARPSGIGHACDRGLEALSTASRGVSKIRIHPRIAG